MDNIIQKVWPEVGIRNMRQEDVKENQIVAKRNIFKEVS